MAEHRDHTTHTTTTGAHATPTDTTTPRSDYRDPRTTTTTTDRRRSGTSWIGAIVALLAVALIIAWWAGSFEGEETAMMVEPVGEPAVEQGVVVEEEAEVLEAQPTAPAVEPAAPAGTITTDEGREVPVLPAPAQQ